uniref:Uncharacterized protein n=1 Tax=Trichobilharzia regenti TaxID=157069 RepID=A0AA85J038_TRIRE|nr:unnamed protein product [Trichobilharzia regenti]
MSVNVENLGYTELRKVAKTYGIKANKKACELRELLRVVLSAQVQEVAGSKEEEPAICSVSNFESESTEANKESSISCSDKTADCITVGENEIDDRTTSTPKSDDEKSHVLNRTYEVTSPKIIHKKLITVENSINHVPEINSVIRKSITKIPADSAFARRKAYDLKRNPSRRSSITPHCITEPLTPTAKLPTQRQDIRTAKLFVNTNRNRSEALNSCKHDRITSRRLLVDNNRRL